MKVKIVSAESVMKLWSEGRAGRDYTVLLEQPGMTEWGPCRPWCEASVLVQDGAGAVWSSGGGPDEETGRQKKPSNKAVRQQIVAWLRENGEALGEVPPRRLSGSPNGRFQEFTWDGPALAVIEVA